MSVNFPHQKLVIWGWTGSPFLKMSDGGPFWRSSRPGSLRDLHGGTAATRPPFALPK